MTTKEFLDVMAYVPEYAAIVKRISANYSEAESELNIILFTYDDISEVMITDMSMEDATEEYYNNFDDVDRDELKKSITLLYHEDPAIY